jgi:Flp pilus assembly protein TadG
MFMAEESTTVLPGSMAPKRKPSLLLPLFGAIAVLAMLAAGYFLQRASEQEALAAARAEISEAQSSAATARKQAERLAAQIAALQSQLLKVKDAAIPALLYFRAGPPGKGFVAQIENQSADALPVTVEAQRPSTGEKKSFELTVPPRGVAEIGAGDGWAFANGDTLTVSSGQLKPLSLRIP